jgi:hypothetical protein
VRKKNIQNSETRSASGFEGANESIQNANRISVKSAAAKPHLRACRHLPEYQELAINAFLEGVICISG